MAAVGVHVELTVRFLTIGTPGKHTTAEVEVRRITVDASGPVEHQCEWNGVGKIKKISHMFHYELNRQLVDGGVLVVQ